jgi:predicted CoA-binding protein
MEVVAVLDISMEVTIVELIRPISRFLGFVPDILRVNLKSVWSSFVFVIAEARKNPPTRSHITLLEKV